MIRTNPHPQILPLLAFVNFEFQFDFKLKCQVYKFFEIFDYDDVKANVFELQSKVIALGQF